MPTRAKTADPEEQLHRMVLGRDADGTGSSIENPVHRASCWAYMQVRDLNDGIKVATRINNVLAFANLGRYLDALHKGLSYEDATKEMLQDFSKRLDRPKREDEQGKPLPLSTPGQGFGYVKGSADLIRVSVKHYYKWLHYREDAAKWPVLPDGRRIRPPVGEAGAGWPADSKLRHRLPYPEIVAWIDATRGSADTLHSSIKKEDAPKRDDFFKMAYGANERDGALVMCFFDAGPRCGGVIALNVGSYRSDVASAYHDGGADAVRALQGRQVSRFGALIIPAEALGLKNEYAAGLRIPVFDAKAFLDRFICVHPFAAWDYAPLFYSTHNAYYPKVAAKAGEWMAWRERVKALQAQGRDVALAGPEPPQPTREEFERLRLTPGTIRRNLQRLAKRVGWNKRMWTHLCRYASVMFHRKKMKDKQLKRRYGWSMKSRMPDKYDLADATDDDRALAEVHGIPLEEISAEIDGLNHPLRCVDGHLNPAGAQFCYVCHIPLDPSRVTHAEHRIADSEVQTLVQNPRVRAALIEALLAELARSDGDLTPEGDTTPRFENVVRLAEARKVIEDARKDREASA